MKNIKLFENFNTESIDAICTKYGIIDYSINADSSINVYGDVDLSGKNLEEIPLKFNLVAGYFDCSNNNLKNLNNSPVFSRSGFDCSNNKITTLKGAPLITKNFNCSNNNLLTLKHTPNEINGVFDCTNNNIVSFIGYPNTFEGTFKCDNNPISLIYDFFGYKSIIGDFIDTHCINVKVNTKPKLYIDELNNFLSNNGFDVFDDSGYVDRHRNVKINYDDRMKMLEKYYDVIF